MLFTAPLFVWFFLAVLLSSARARSLGVRKAILLGASYLFYASWSFPEGLYILPLLVCSSLLDYALGAWLYRHPHGPPLRRRLALALSLTLHLGMLGYFKYIGFGREILADFSAFFELGLQLKALEPYLPLGISFFTFQSMSYTIDAYRRQGAPYRSAFDFLLFVAFFPQLIAGPIVRAETFRAQLDAPPRTSWLRLDRGLRLFALGALLKIVLADNLAGSVDALYSQPERLSRGDAWFAFYGFGAQIYGDFAGYSLMAIGLAHTLGFALPENFDRPYLAGDIRDFWRRWHITLSTWLRDYLYIPLGGSRRGPARAILALFVTMSLGGLWHGASWSFVLWGSLHGAWLGLHRVWSRRIHLRSRPARFLGWLGTLHGVLLLWILFRAPTLGVAAKLLERLLWGPAGRLHAESHEMVPFLAAFGLWLFAERLGRLETRVDRLRPPAAAALLGAAAVLVACFHSGGVSFIYFAF